MRRYRLASRQISSCLEELSHRRAEEDRLGTAMRIEKIICTVLREVHEW